MTPWKQRREELIRQIIEATEAKRLIASLPRCAGCGKQVIVGKEGLVHGKYCATCGKGKAA